MVSSLCIWGYHVYATNNATKKFESRYTLLTETIAETLNQLDKSSDLFLLNSARMLQVIDQKSDSSTNWEEEAKKLNLTHIFIANSEGDFIVSTNEPPERIPNILSFCKSYKNVLLDVNNYETTPIIPPTPEPYPYKFLIAPSLDKKRYLEVAVKVDFIGDTLKQLLKRDKNILKIQLFTPNGINLGSFGPMAKQYKRFKADKSQFQLGKIVHKRNQSISYTKVPSNVTTCCQCNQSGLSLDNQYYYVLKTDIDKTQLQNDYKNILLFSLLAQLLSILLACFLSKRISISLTRRISMLDSSIETMLLSNNISKIQIKGNDEIANLGNHFNKLLNRVNTLNSEILASKDLELRFKFSRMIAHDLAAPIEAIQFLQKRVANKDPDEAKMLSSIAEKLDKLTTDLRNTILELNQGEINITDHPLSSQDIVKLTRDVVSMFNAFTLGNNIEMNFSSSQDQLFSNVNSYLYSRIISNILQNSFQAINGNGLIQIKITRYHSTIEIMIKDTKKEEALSQDTSKNYGLGIKFIENCVNFFSGEFSLKVEKNSACSIIKLPLS